MTTQQQENSVRSPPSCADIMHGQLILVRLIQGSQYSSKTQDKVLGYVSLEVLR